MHWIFHFKILRQNHIWHNGESEPLKVVFKYISTESYIFISCKMPMFWFRYTHVTFLLAWRATDLETIWRKNSFMYSIVCKFGSLTSYLGRLGIFKQNCCGYKVCFEWKQSLQAGHKSPWKSNTWSYLLIVPTLSFCSSVSCHCLCHTVEAY